MRKTITLAATAVAISLGAGAALAEGHVTQPSLAGPKIYAYESHVNYCPAGLQPVTINGVICCGTPNAGISYQQAMSHPVRKRHYRRTADCPIGVKGCN